MFIKVHSVTSKEMYINTEWIEQVTTADGYTRLYTCFAPLGYDVKESVDDIMKIIGYFKVGEK